MGSFDSMTEHLKRATERSGSPVLVTASPQFTSALLDEAGADGIPGLRIVAADADAPIDVALLAGLPLAVIEVDPANRASIHRISSLRTHFPDLTLVAAINGASLSLVRTLLREGISDVVALPFDREELLQVALDAVARDEAMRSRQQASAPMIMVTRSLGGCGATSIATHLAADFARHDTTGRGAMIVDADMQFGGVGEYLGVQSGRGSLADLLEAESRLDEDLLASVTNTVGGGVSVIAAPDAIMPLESIDTDALLRVLTFLRRQSAAVIVDLPANWTNWALSAALAADKVVLIVELSVASLRQAKRRLELFRSAGIDNDAIKIVVNRVEKRLFKSIDFDDVARTLHHPVLGGVALDTARLASAQTQGVLIGSIQPKSPFAMDIGRIGAALRAEIDGTGR